MVIDSAKMLRDFADDRELRRRAVRPDRRIRPKPTRCCCLSASTRPRSWTANIEFSLADGIVQLEYQAREPVDRRSLRVCEDARHAASGRGRHTFQIGPGGIEVFPRIETLIPARAWSRSSGRVAQRDPRPGRADGRRPMGRLTPPSSRGLPASARPSSGCAGSAQGLEEGEHVPLRHVPGHRRSAHRMAARLRLGHRGRPGRWTPGDLVRPDGQILTWTSSRARVRAELAEHPVSRVAIDSLAELVHAARESERFPAYMRSLVGLDPRRGSLAGGHQRNGRRTELPPNRWKGSCSCSTTSSTCDISKKDPSSAARSTSLRCETARTR